MTAEASSSIGGARMINDSIEIESFEFSEGNNPNKCTSPMLIVFLFNLSVNHEENKKVEIKIPVSI
jgi:hypothetical protein